MAKRSAEGSWGQWVIAAAIVAFIVSAISAVSVSEPRGPRQPQLKCMTNVSQLVQLFLVCRHERPVDPTLHGSAQILSWGWPDIPRDGHERVYFCDEDDLDAPDTPEERAQFHPATSDALRGARGLGSYAVRDFERFPVEPGDEPAWILCERLGDDGRTLHHKGGIVVGFSDGSAQMMTREDLGLGADEPIVVGPESAHAELRKMERP